MSRFSVLDDGTDSEAEEGSPSKPAFVENAGYELELNTRFRFTERYGMNSPTNYRPTELDKRAVDGVHACRGVCEYVRKVAGRKTVESGISDDHKRLYTKILDEHDMRGALVIGEVGFAPGSTAEFFLQNCPRSRVISFDIMDHLYTADAKAFIDKRYPKRHRLIGGSSIDQLPAFRSWNPALKFDIFVIDGNHLYDYVMEDMRNVMKLSKPETVIILNNVSPHRGVSRQSYLAWKQLIQKGKINHLGFQELNPRGIIYVEDPKIKAYADGCAWFGKPGKLVSSVMPDFKHIERCIAGWELTRMYLRSKDQHSSELLDYLYRKTIKTGTSYVDDFYKRV